MSSSEVRLIDANALKNEMQRVVIDIADTPAPDEYTSKLVAMLAKIFQKKIDEAPAVAEPVRRGRWEDIKGAIRCSECQEKPLYDYHGRLVLTRWCHACGAKMWKEIKSENH